MHKCPRDSRDRKAVGPGSSVGRCATAAPTPPPTTSTGIRARRSASESSRECSSSQNSRQQTPPTLSARHHQQKYAGQSCSRARGVPGNPARRTSARHQSRHDKSCAGLGSLDHQGRRNRSCGHIHAWCGKGGRCGHAVIIRCGEIDGACESICRSNSERDTSSCSSGLYRHRGRGPGAWSKRKVFAGDNVNRSDRTVRIKVCIRGGTKQRALRASIVAVA